MSNLYNFYCIKSIAKPFYRRLIYHGVNNLQFHSLDFELEGKIIKYKSTISSYIEIQYKNKCFYERCIYSPFDINYTMYVYKGTSVFDNKVQIIKDFGVNTRVSDRMDTDLWISLSEQNQTTLNYIYNVLDTSKNI